MDLLEACCNSRELLDEILECSRDAIIIADLEGHILFASPVVKKVLGYESTELEGGNLSVIFTPEDLRYFYPNLLHMANKNMPFEGELMFLRKNGTRFFAFIVFKSYFDPIQNRAIIAACIQDIDKEKQLEKTFRESHYEDLVQIANGIAHEIRNPLMGIGGFINRIFKSGTVTHDQDKYYDYIISNLKKIEDRVKKVDFFASLPRPSLSEESIEELLEKAVEPFQQEIEDQRIDLNIRVGKMHLIVDNELITNVFSILIANALDAVSDEGAITIYNETTAIHCKICVSDTGSGILPKDIPHIFNPFFSTKPEGAGIDLATAKRIMDNHGGRIEVTSKKGEGTTFTLHFPLEKRQPLRICSLKINAPAQSEGNRVNPKAALLSGYNS